MHYKQPFLAVLILLLFTGRIAAQDDAATATGPEYEWLKPLAGHYEVTMRIWPKADAAAVPLGTFKVTRQFIGNFLQEVMEPMPGSETPPFTRITYLGFNKINRRWEYIVLDTRFPVMMFETSFDEKITNGKTLTMYLPAFPVPAFIGRETAGQMAKQRRTITVEDKDHDAMYQYWTLPSGKEYRAIEYLYKRVP